MPAADSTLVVAAMKTEHLDQVLAVERASFATPWSRASFMTELQGNRFARAWVALTPEEPPQLLGYLCSWIIYEELRIQNLAVGHAWRRRGVGTAMLAHAIDAGRKAGCVTANLEVRPGNEPALSLYRAFGFTKTRRRPGYYADTAEDALVLTLDLTPPIS